MVSTRNKRQSNRRLLSHLDDFHQDIIFGNAASESQENTVVKKSTEGRDLTIDVSSKSVAINENTVNVKTLEKTFNERIDKERNNIVDTVEDSILNAILNAIDNIVAPKIELAIRSINASSGWDATNVTANSDHGEHARFNASFEKASGNNNILHVSNVNDETQHNIPDEVSELWVPETRFDRHTYTHHMVTGQTTQTNQITEFLTAILTPRNPPSHQQQNLSTKVSPDNSLPMAEQTPRKQNI